VHIESASHGARTRPRFRAPIRTQCIGCGCLSLKQCHLANPADAAAGLGPGPRYLMSNARRPKK
jgi:hypothetical protein